MIKPLIINATEETPQVILDPRANKFEMEGNSYPANAPSFYDKILIWLADYATNPNPETQLKLTLSYWNSASYKYLLQVIKVLEEMHKSGKKVGVIWMYDDTDNQELGMEYSELLNCHFTLVEATKDKK